MRRPSHLRTCTFSPV
ncbi:hypothetical protein LINPERPRIM_LOCUS21076 [Linum perenne]